MHMIYTVVLAWIQLAGAQRFFVEGFILIYFKLLHSRFSMRPAQLEACHCDMLIGPARIGSLTAEAAHKNANQDSLCSEAVTVGA